MREEFLWVEKYRPTTLNDCILTKENRDILNGYLDKKEIGNILLQGSQGTGKTTVAKALVQSLNIDHIFINASNERNIDTLRDKIMSYASTVSFRATKKVVILDEMDHLNPNTFQPAFRSVMEKFSKNCSYIGTCNYPEKIIPALRSRFVDLNFSVQSENKEELLVSFIKRVMQILKEENVVFDKKVVITLCSKFFPDYRKTIGELQKYSVNGKLDSSVLSSTRNVRLDQIFTLLKKKNFGELKTYVDTTDIDARDLLNTIYDQGKKYLSDQAYAQTILWTYDTLKDLPFVANDRISLMQFFVSIMQFNEKDFK